MRPYVIAAVLVLAACQDAMDPPIGSPDASTAITVDAADRVDAKNCTPKTCATLAAQCGTIGDGCGGTLDCGTCNFGDVCTNNSCVCAPYCGSRECGSDGCGGSCGTCGTNETCTTSGQCKWTGGGTMPPADWHCNDAYWDAGDGCDCNCGALDPDCGQSGQSLHGCTGLTNPTCDPQGLCTGGGACNAVPASPYLTLYLMNTAAPTMSGGTIHSGRWEANGVTHYGGASGYVTGGGDGSAIEISGTTWKRVIRRVGGYPNVDENFTASVSGNTITLTRTCSTTTTQTMTFTGSATSLTISQYSGGKTVVYTYTKKW
jgi:hypothetical protein